MPPGLILEFKIADLGQRVEVADLTENLYGDLTEKVDEKDIVGLQILPQRWPRKVHILCQNQAAKDCLMIQGVDIYGRHVELNEPGNGVVKVVIQDAPLDMPNDVIKAWVSQYGTLSEFRNEHVMIRGKRTVWRTGNRIAYFTTLNHEIPPAAKIRHNDSEIDVTIWHYGQTHMKCRWCKDIVPKGHDCDKAPKRRCFNCGSEGHMKAECTVGKCCFKCGNDDHLAKDCTQVKPSNGNEVGEPSSKGSFQDREDK